MASLAPIVVKTISYILKHRIVRDRTTGDIIELRYLVILDVREGGAITRIGPLERTVEQLKAEAASNCYDSIENYWATHGLLPRCAREILEEKDPLDYQPLWGRLPFEEARAMFYLHSAELIHLWKPRFTMVDAAYIYRDVQMRELNVNLGNIEENTDIEEDELATPAYSPLSPIDPELTTHREDEDPRVISARIHQILEHLR
jgi:hypothetical protein